MAKISYEVCDRCGVPIYDDNAETDENVVKLWSVRHTTTLLCYSTVNAYNLCQDCAKELQDWLKKGAKLTAPHA